MISVLVGLGSNIDREYHIAKGILALKNLDSNCRCSHIFEAEPVGFTGANFYNLVVQLQTSLSLKQMVSTLREIESRFGRKENAIKYQDRTLDIDLLTYGSLCQSKDPKLPRDDIYKFAFTLQPLAQLCPDCIIPGDNKTYRQCWAEFEVKQRLWPLTDISFIEKYK